MTDSAAAEQVAECPACGMLQMLPAPASRHVRRCQRCRTSLGHGVAQRSTALALAVTALVLFCVANLAPFLGVEVGGRGNSVRLASDVGGLAEHDLLPLAVFVLAISVLAPVGRVLALTTVLLLLPNQGSRLALAPWLRFADFVRPWAMLDVFLIGTLVALTKLQDLASVDIGTGLWSLAPLVLAIAALDMTLDSRVLWDRIGPPSHLAAPPVALPPASGAWSACHECGLVQAPAPRCRRCSQALHRRKPASQSRTAALVLTGLVLYVPANLYPVLTVVSFGRRNSATILGGVSELMNGSDWPLAIIVFTASIAVPLLKLLGLGWLLLSTQLRLRRRLSDRTRLFRLIEMVSRWSSVDVFVAALLTALVTLGNLATIEPGLGVLAFGAVVFVTMLATECFDPRLMWDAAEANNA